MNFRVSTAEQAARIRDWAELESAKVAGVPQSARVSGSTGFSATTSPANAVRSPTEDAEMQKFLGGGAPGGWASNHYEESRLVTGWNFCAVRAIARACAKSQPQVFATGGRARSRIDAAQKDLKKGKIPQEVYEVMKASMTASSSGDDAIPVPPTHPLLYRLTHPNPWMSGAQYRFQYSQQLSVTGTALRWTRRNGFVNFDPRGVPVGLYVIPTGITLPQPPSFDYPDGLYRIIPVGAYGGVRVSESQWYQGEGNFGDFAWSNLMMLGGTVDGREVRPVRWPHPLFLTDGLSPEAAGELWIDIASLLDRATWYGFRNTLRPGYIFEMEATADEPNKSESDRFDKEIANRASGIDNVGKSIRLPKGVKIADADRSVHELDYIAGRKEIGSNVLALHACPPIAIGVQQPGAYAAYYAALLQFIEQAVEPQLSLMAEEDERDLAPAFGGELEVKYPPPPVNDKQQMEGELSNDSRVGSLSFNEYRKIRNRPPWPEKIGSLPVNTPAEVLTRLWMKEVGLDAAEVFGDNPPNPSEPGGGPGASERESVTPPTPADSDVGDNKNPLARGRPVTGIGPARRGGVQTRRKFTEPPGYFRPGLPNRDFSLNGHG